MTEPVIPLFRPDSTDLEEQNVIRVLRSGWWGLGPETAKFEEELAAYVKAGAAEDDGAPLYPVATNSASLALEIAARCLVPDARVRVKAIVPALTFVSSATAMQKAGFPVEFCDIDEETLCLDWADAHDRLPAGAGRLGTIIIPVWYAGTVTRVPNPVSWDWADSFEDAVILEDCAHAAGSADAGMQGDASAWSFHAVKNLAAGDGGMILFRSQRAAEQAKRLRWFGISKSTHERVMQKGYGWDYEVTEPGEKAHMNDITAAIARAQLQRLHKNNLIRRAIAGAYDDALAPLDWLRRPVLSARSAQHMYVVRVPAASRADFVAHLLDRGVSAGVHYRPLYHYQNLFPDAPFLPVTERVWPTLTTLPLFPSMNGREIERVVEAVSSFKPKAE